MGRIVSTGVAALVVAANLVSTASAQAPAMTADRSREVQSIVTNIERNKDAAVAQLLGEWQASLDPTVYNVWSELGDIARNAPAWQVYGAALTGDFQTMTRILTGREGAGRYVNALTAPQPKAAQGFGLDGTAALGATSTELVYTPISPCRVVDTRGSGARTGVIPANGTRSFDLTTDGLAEGQGGAASCTGLPNFSYYGWAVNITVTNGYVAAGGLKAWGFSATEPNASIINFGPASAGGIANGLNLTGCYGCADDITIRSFGDATHVIIDVVGYYQPAAVSNATVTRVAGTAVSITNGSAAFGTGGACPAGTSLIGGENDFSGTRVYIGESRQANATQWTMWMINDDGATRTPTVYSRCMDTPLKQ